eukprot:TRINITY_DN4173_c0_g1_i1.p1 TRINITY_DN4173_c0_g1~~TRINITY_DN4173_c0_g1_i1.p1  ORF type:complete len:925 (+),score=193.57 TRINITY_DN4173_c0_g1_i1:50-2824(+)
MESKRLSAYIKSAMLPSEPESSDLLHHQYPDAADQSAMMRELHNELINRLGGQLAALPAKERDEQKHEDQFKEALLQQEIDDRKEANDENQEDENVCRVCRCEATETQPLFHPCLCRGSIKFVHEDCLTQWLKTRGSTKCELCGHMFSFEPVLAPNAPHDITLSDVLTWVLTKASKLTPTIGRFVLAVVVWIGLVSVVTAWMFKAVWAPSMSQIPDVVMKHALSGSVIADIQTGVIVCAAIVVVSVCIACVRELLRMHDHDNVQNVMMDGNPNLGNGNAVPIMNNPDPAFDFLEDGDDIPLAQWIGLDGPLSYLAVHVLTVLLYNFVFLNAVILLPLTLGRMVLWSFDVNAESVSWKILFAARNWILDFVLTETAPFRVALSSDESLRRFYDSVDFSNIFFLSVGYCAGAAAASVWFVSCVVFDYQSTYAQMLRKTVRYIYVGLKVCLLLSIELACCPVIFGICIDFLTLNLRDLDVKMRKDSVLHAPVSNLILFWLLGFSFMLFISMLASVLRKSIRQEVVDMILRNPDDPEFQPIRELIEIPFLRHIQRLVITIIVYIFLLILGLHLPSRIIVKHFSFILPFQVRFNDPIEMPADILLFHVCFPIVLERFNLSQYVVKLTKLWFSVVSKLVGLSSFLMPSEDPQFFYPTPHNIPHFAVRLVCLSLLGWLTHMGSVVVVFVGPIAIGRFALGLLHSSFLGHDMYAFFIGINVYFGIIWGLIKMVEYFQRFDGDELRTWLRKWILIGAKVSFLSLLVLGIAPLLAGLLFELVIVTPLRVPVNETPLFFVYQDWAMGLVALKVWSRFVVAGVFGDNTWKRNMERVNRQNLEELEVVFVFRDILIPLLYQLAECVAVPYAFSTWIFPSMVSSPILRMVCFRYSFLVYTIFLVIKFFGGYVNHWSSCLRRQVFEDKYVVGKSLRNVN